MNNFKEILDEFNKTEHTGAKKGKGAYRGKKKDAKKLSNKKRRSDSKKASNMNEASYKELQDLGYQMCTNKGDGKHASIHGKNYGMGYWKKKYEEAEKNGDKLGMKIAKREMADLANAIRTKYREVHAKE